jgi:hypothetical protein
MATLVAEREQCRKRATLIDEALVPLGHEHAKLVLLLDGLKLADQ